MPEPKVIFDSGVLPALAFLLKLSDYFLIITIRFKKEDNN